MDILFTSVGTAFGHVLDWIGTFLSSLVSADGELNALLPLVAISVSVSLLMLGIVRQVQQLKAAGNLNVLTDKPTSGNACSDLRYAFCACKAR